MVRLMTKLSSYTVHFAARMGSDTYDVTDPVIPILDDILAEAADTTNIIYPLTDVQRVSRSSFMTTDKPIPVAPVIKEMAIPQRIKLRMNVYPGIRVKVEQDVVVDMVQPPIDIIRVRTSFEEWTLAERVADRDMDGFRLDQLPK